MYVICTIDKWCSGKSQLTFRLDYFDGFEKTRFAASDRVLIGAINKTVHNE